MDLNKVMIIGRLTKDPEMRTTPSGINVTSLSVATNYSYTNKETGQKIDTPEYHNVVLWRKLGEIAQQYLKKGTQVYIEGRLQTRTWDGADGKKNYRTEIIGDNMIMLQRAAGQSAPSGSYNSAPQSTAPKSPSSDFMPVPSAEELPTINQDEEINVEGIPF
jgi:single-strand DNA-binding protein